MGEEASRVGEEVHRAGEGSYCRGPKTMTASEWKIIASGQEKIIRFRSYPGFIEIQTITAPVEGDGRINTVKLRAEHWNKILVGIKEARIAEENERAGKFTEPPTKEEPMP